MKIFVYTNKLPNYVSGHYYFIASRREQADVMAKRFKKDKNKNVTYNRNYMIAWDDEVLEWEIKPGYIPLNRAL